MRTEVIQFRAGTYNWVAIKELSGFAHDKLWSSPDSWFAGKETVRPVADRKATAVVRHERFPGAKSAVFIKRYRTVRKRDHFKNAFRASKAERSFELGLFLLKHNIPTARPLAAGSEKEMIFLRRAFLVTEELPDVVCLEFFRWQDPFKKLQVKALRNLARLFAALYAIKYLHTDSHSSNFFVRLHDHQIALIDLDGLRYRPAITERMIYRNLKEFFRNTPLTRKEFTWFVAQLGRSAHGRVNTRALYERLLRRVKFKA